MSQSLLALNVHLSITKNGIDEPIPKARPRCLITLCRLVLRGITFVKSLGFDRFITRERTPHPLQD